LPSFFATSRAARRHPHGHDLVVEVLHDRVEPVHALDDRRAVPVRQRPAELAEARGREDELADEVEEVVELLCLHADGAGRLGRGLLRRGPRGRRRGALRRLADGHAREVRDLREDALERLKRLAGLEDDLELLRGKAPGLQLGGAGRGADDAARARELLQDEEGADRGDGAARRDVHVHLDAAEAGLS
jgi:hypothetical protein